MLDRRNLIIKKTLLPIENLPRPTEEDQLPSNRQGGLSPVNGPPLIKAKPTSQPVPKQTKPPRNLPQIPIGNGLSMGEISQN